MPDYPQHDVAHPEETGFRSWEPVFTHCEVRPMGDGRVRLSLGRAGQMLAINLDADGQKHLVSLLTREDQGGVAEPFGPGSDRVEVELG